MPTREEAHSLLCEYTQNANLRKHAYAVEAAMRLYAERLGGDPDEWGTVGLLHDFDYEQYPQAPDHATQGAETLRERGYPEHWIRAILSHADYMNVPRETPMAKALFAIDELTGFIVAVALVRPTKSIMDVEVKSVRKKMKDKAFAAAVSREDIAHGAEALGIPLDEHIAVVIQAMQGIAAELGLPGS
ncbi:MAG: HDIG domain-containing protein [Armatimonadetes bacterium]|nr:HDIG domain-containing protein [Armatimonadota bacterium]